MTGRQYEVVYSYENQKEEELPQHSRLRVYLPERAHHYIEIAYNDTGGVDLRASGALIVQMNASNACVVDLAEYYERRADARYRDLAVRVFQLFQDAGADFNDMCALAAAVQDKPGDHWRKLPDWVARAAETLKQRFSKAR